MTKTEALGYVQIVGGIGLLAVALSLISATVRFPGQTLSVFTGITPLINAELVHNKTELVSILGPTDSENRKVIANRLPVFGEDVIPAFAIFLFGLYKLARWFRPDFHTDRPS